MVPRVKPIPAWIVVNTDAHRTVTRLDVAKDALHTAGKPSCLDVGVETRVMVDYGGWQLIDRHRLLGAPGAADGNVSYVLTKHRMFRDIYECIYAEW